MRVVIILFLMTTVIGCGASADSVGSLASAKAIWWSTQPTHFMLGGRGSKYKDWCCEGDARARLAVGSANSSCTSSSGWYYCQSYCGPGGAGTPCNDVGETGKGKKYHFDCVGFITEVFRELGKSPRNEDYVDEYLGGETQWTVTDLYSALPGLPDPSGGNRKLWKWHENTHEFSDKYASRRITPADAYDPLWATELAKGSILIFAPLSDKVDDSDPNGKHHYYFNPDNVGHSALCVNGFDESNELPEMVSSREPSKVGSVSCSTHGLCVDPNDSGVIKETLSTFLDNGRAAFNNPETYCGDKPHGFFGYFTLNECMASITVTKTADCETPVDGITIYLKDKPDSDSTAKMLKQATVTDGKVKFLDIPLPGAGKTVDYYVTDASGSEPTIKVGTRTLRTNSVKVTVSGDNGCVDYPVTLANVTLWPLTVTKFADCNMNGVKDEGEEALGGWPIRLDGPAGTQYGVTCSSDGCLDANGNSVPKGSFRFVDLPSGTYTVTETSSDGRISWESIKTTCGTTTYSDWRTTWYDHDGAATKDRRWQATGGSIVGGLTYGPSSSAAPLGAPGISPVVIDCAPLAVNIGNVPLTTVSAFKFHDINMNGRYEPDGEPHANRTGKWFAGEPFTDQNCDGKWNSGEYYSDLNNNGQYDGPEPYTDLDGDKHYDWPECGIDAWPFALWGTRADHEPICPIGKTDSTGSLTFSDIAPSDTNDGYHLKEDVVWCPVNLGWPGDPQLRTACSAKVASSPGGCNTIDRWQATTSVKRDFRLACREDHSESFGNVCLTTVNVKKIVYDDAPPGVGQGTPTPGAGNKWKIDLSGTDHFNRDIIPSSSQCNLLTSKAATPPISLGCVKPVWYETTTYASRTDTCGQCCFYDLLPGHYHLAEQPNADYKLKMSEPSLSGFDVLCCPRSFTFENFKKDFPYRVFQVYPGSSLEKDQEFVGYQPESGDAITAAPGVLQIIPGKDWCNFKEATQLCQPGPIKNVLLTKDTPSFIQCSEVFAPRHISQQGTRNIRLWWPLMYEAPGTIWTLYVQYGSGTAMKYPGDTSAGYFHNDVWKWRMESDLEHMLLLTDLFHEMPYGLDEVPLISNDALHQELKQILTDTKALYDSGDTANASLALGQFELIVSDSCISSSPSTPSPGGPETGIAQSNENPACCKLLIDTEYVSKKFGIFATRK